MSASLKFILLRPDLGDSSAADIVSASEANMLEPPSIRVHTLVGTFNDFKINFAKRGSIEGIEQESSGEIMAIDITEGCVYADDPANKELLGMINPKTIRLMMFTQTKNAQWACDKLCQMLSFPPFEVSFKTNRDLFRLEPGDLFKFSYEQYGMTDVILRVITIAEAALDSEDIMVHCVRDYNYISTGYSYGGELQERDVPPSTDPYKLEPLKHFTIIEAPYILSLDTIEVVPIATKNIGNELGYHIYMSVDGGTSYFLIGTKQTFSPHGILVSDYTEDRDTVDDTIGFTVDASFHTSWSSVQSITRDTLYAGMNVAMLGNEIISFQTVTPDAEVDGRYYITGVWGGRFDSVIQKHFAGENFFFLDNRIKLYGHTSMVVGATLYFKFVPFSTRTTMDISNVPFVVLTLTGRAKAPYPVENLKANDEMDNPVYSEDIVLKWDARHRSSGAGTQLPEIPDDPDTWEGDFKVEVFHKLSDSSGAVFESVRTVDSVDAQTWTYTKEMNLGDGDSSGVGLADEVIFRVYNYIDDVGTALTYESDARKISVTLIPL